MKEERFTAIALALSLGMHIAIIGASGGFFSSQDEPLLKTQVLPAQKNKTPLLPEIRVIGEFKQFSPASVLKPQEAGLEKKAFTQAIDTLRTESIETDDKAEKSMLRYQDTVKQKIESSRHYPMRAQRMRLEGVVDIAFVINKDGTSRNIKVVGSSGSKLLDAEALNNISKASPFMPLPKEISKNSIDIRVAIVFSLD